MELNTSLAHVPSQFKTAAVPRAERKRPKEEKQQQQLDATSTGMGAKSLAALAGKEASKSGSVIVASQLKQMRAKSVGGASTTLHPNSWQLHANAIPPPKDDAVEQVIEFSDE
jgi:hypothetical protein